MNFDFIWGGAALGVFIQVVEKESSVKNGVLLLAPWGEDFKLKFKSKYCTNKFHGHLIIK